MKIDLSNNVSDFKIIIALNANLKVNLLALSIDCFSLTPLGGGVALTCLWLLLLANSLRCPTVATHLSFVSAWSRS
jgi:hypothetical protein